MGLRTIKSGVTPCRLMYNRGAVTLSSSRGSVLAIFIVPLKQCTRAYGRSKCLTMPYALPRCSRIRDPGFLMAAPYIVYLPTSGCHNSRLCSNVSSLLMRQKPTRNAYIIGSAQRCHKFNDTNLSPLLYWSVPVFTNLSNFSWIILQLPSFLWVRNSPRGRRPNSRCGASNGCRPRAHGLEDRYTTVIRYSHLLLSCVSYIYIILKN